MKKYAVYVHRRKDNNQPFYIGCCSRQDTGRYVGTKKYRRAFDFGLRRPRWFQIRDDAGGVNVEIAFMFDDKKIAYEKEDAMVEMYGRECFNNGLLTNECRGGAGCPGQYNSMETRRKKSITKIGELNPMFGKTGEDHPNSRRVIDIALNKSYASVLIAAEEYGYKMKTLYNWLSGHRKNPTNLRFA